LTIVLDWDRARVLVEFGPGVGTITRQILERMRPDATLVAIELNDDFARLLKANIDDPRLRVVHRTAAEVNAILRELGQPKADYLIAGIPFSILSDEDRESVLRAAYDALRDDGVMLVYQFSARVRADLEKIFRVVHQTFEARNILPARVFHCVK
jgi:phospholipid N-methyltransferase